VTITPASSTTTTRHRDDHCATMTMNTAGSVSPRQPERRRRRHCERRATFNGAGGGTAALPTAGRTSTTGRTRGPDVPSPKPPVQHVRATPVDLSGGGPSPSPWWTQALLSPGLTRRLIAQLAPRAASPRLNAHALAQLTTRERQIVGLLAHGLSNTEISAELTISHATAKTHVSRAMTKLGARDRAQLAALAYRHSLIEPRDPAPLTTTAPLAPDHDRVAVRRGRCSP
jgi:DNA-binding CsgD family transcriptional regulator